MGRAEIQGALEALEMGDVRGAELILLDALDAATYALAHKRDKAGYSLGNTGGAAGYANLHTCDGCGRTFEWPGLLEAHRLKCVALWEPA